MKYQLYSAPHTMKTGKLKYLVIYKGGLIETTFVKSVLEKQGVKAYLQSFDYTDPHSFRYGVIDPIRIVIASCDVDKAIKIIVRLINDEIDPYE